MRSTPGIVALGAILAGGASRRFGAPKAVATVGGISMLERAASALRAAGLTPVVIGDGSGLECLGPGYAELPTRTDVVPGCGPLGGLRTALGWATELGLGGAVCIPCDLPLLPPPLLRELRRRGERSHVGAVVAEGPGAMPEPLCAWYSVAALPQIEARLAGGLLSLQGLLSALETERIHLTDVARYGDPSRIFLNVNTPTARETAERLMRDESPDNRG